MNFKNLDVIMCPCLIYRGCLPVWKVCIARRISPARNFDAFYIFTIKFSKSPARNFQTFQSGLFICGEPEGEPAWIPELDKFKRVLAFIWDPTLTDLNFPHKRNDLGWLS